MRLNTIFYILGQGFKGVFRNRVMTIASMLVLIACMVLVGTFYLVIDTIDRNFKDIEDIRVIEIMMDKDYDKEDIVSVGEQLAEICDNSPAVDWSMDMWSEDEVLPKDENFTFVSSDEHLQIMLDTYDEDWIREIFEADELEDLEHNSSEGDNDGVVSSIKDNPLRASFRITFMSFSDMDEVLRIRNQIDSVTIIDDNGTEIDAIPFEDIKNNIDLYNNVMSVKNILYVVGIWLMAIFLLISLFVIMNTIKLGVSARENEIKFMRLCGATKRFIRMPFMVEGVLIGIFSAAVSFGIEFYLYEYLLKGIISSAAGNADAMGIATGSFMSDYGLLLGLAFIVIGLFAGIIASGISMKKFLKA